MLFVLTCYPLWYTLLFMLSIHQCMLNEDNMFGVSAIRETVADNLKRLRESHDMSKAAFARYCGMAQPVYLRLESGELTQHLESLIKIATKCGLQVWQLLVPEFDPSNPPVLKHPSAKELEFYARIKQAMRDLHIEQ